MKYSLLFLLVSSLVLNSTVVAEPQVGSVGRTKDGRAYRIDEQGLKLVDQIAELEVSVQELRGEVSALENELIDRDKLISDLRKGRDIPPQVTRQPVASPTAVCPACPEQSVRKDTSAQQAAQQIKAENAALSTRNANLENSVASLKAQLAEENKRFALLQKETSSVQGEQEGNVNTLRTQVTQQQGLLSAKEQTVSSLQEELAQQKAIAASEQQKLSAFEKELVAVKLQLEEAQKLTKQASIREQEFRADAANSARIAKRNERAALASRNEDVAVRQVNAAAQVEKDETTVEFNPELIKGQKQKFNSQLATIQKLILDRKTLADGAKSKSKGISVSLRPLVSKAGFSLDNLRSKVSKLNAESDVSQIQAGLNDVEAILKDDIGVLKRLQKI